MKFLSLPRTLTLVHVSGVQPVRRRGQEPVPLRRLRHLSDRRQGALLPLRGLQHVPAHAAQDRRPQGEWMRGDEPGEQEFKALFNQHLMVQ